MTRSVRHALSLLALSLVASCHEASPQADVRIVGGTLSHPGLPGHASTVALLRKGAPHCTGTLIADNLILTAAHCLDTQPFELTVSFATVVTGPERDRELERDVTALSTFHPDKALFFPNWDVGWVRFTGSTPSGFAPAEILRDPKRLPERAALNLIGFGRTATLCREADGLCAGKKLALEARLRRYFDERFARSLLVTEAETGKGACHGDSGGPAFVTLENKLYVTGVLSGNEPRLTPEAFVNRQRACEAGIDIYGFPGAYVDWIQKSAGVTLAFSPENPPAAQRTAFETTASNHPFVRECERDDLPADTWRAFDLLLRRARTLRCDEGWTWLASQKRLDLVGEDIRDPSPLRHAVGLEEVDLEGNQVSDVSFALSLPKLRTLSFAKNRSLRNVSALANHESLVSLDLSGTLVDDITALARLRSLRTLKLNHLAPEVAEQARALRQISSLSLYGMRIAALPCFSLLQGLRELDIGFTSVADLAPLQCLPTLRSLHAEHIPATHFAPLVSLPFLESLDIGDNTIIQAHALSLSRSLARLDLADAKVDSLAFIARLEALRTLDLNNVSDSQGRKGLSLPASLEEISVRGLGLTDLAFLERARNLVKLDAAVNQLADLRSIARFRGLRRLNLLGNGISDASPLAALTELEELNLANNIIGNADFVASLRHLKSLEIGWNQLTSAEAFAAAENLTFLDLSQNPIPSIAALGRLPHLRTLRFYFWDIPETEKKCPFADAGICDFAYRM